MKATIKTVGAYGNSGVFRLGVEYKAHCDFGCNDSHNPQEIISALGDARRQLHNKLDMAIDTATADFLKSKLKNIY
jgi:hypothetical protein